MEKIIEFKELPIFKSFHERDKLDIIFNKIRTKINEIITQKKITIPQTDIFFSNYHNKEINDRIKKTNGSCDNLLSLNYKGEMIEGEYNSELVFDKLNKLEEEEDPALFSLSVRFYNWKLKDLSLNVGTAFTTLNEMIDNSKRSKMLGGLFEFSLPYKEEAKRILLYIGNIIINKNTSVKIQGGITVEEDGKKVSLLFSKKRIARTIREQVVETPSQKGKAKAKVKITPKFPNSSVSARDASAAAASALSTTGTFQHTGTPLKNMSA